MLILKPYLTDFIDLLMPRCCICCQRKLLTDEKHLCISCLAQLPLSNDWKIPQNNLKTELEELFPIVYGAALLAYESESKYHQILHHLKYKEQPFVGNFFGEMLGKLILSNEVLSSADYICPIPLHPKKEKKRGYNQSFHLAQGIALRSKIPLLEDNIRRTRNTKTQTKMNFEERQVNMNSVFQCLNPAIFEGKHLILVDDVVTTGSTMGSCAQSILSVCNARISVLCLTRIL